MELCPCLLAQKEKIQQLQDGNVVVQAHVSNFGHLSFAERLLAEHVLTLRLKRKLAIPWETIVVLKIHQYDVHRAYAYCRTRLLKSQELPLLRPTKSLIMAGHVPVQCHQCTTGD